MATRVGNSQNQSMATIEKQLVEASKASSKEQIRQLGRELWSCDLGLKPQELDQQLVRLAGLLPANLAEQLVDAFNQARQGPASAKDAAQSQPSGVGAIGTVHPALAGLEPRNVWLFFSDLARIPHETGNEAGVREYIKAFAAARHIKCEVNDVGDVLLRVNPDARGTPVALQAHLDMVCVSKDGAPYDFAKEPIHIARDGDSIHAEGTSLGADNGIGVAYALALADEWQGPLEILLTVDEEQGFSGINGVAPDWLKAKALINVDSEEEGFFTIASAGARDFLIRLPAERADPPTPVQPMTLVLDGLKGGHSGIDIVHGRTNALKAMGPLLAAAKEFGGVVYGLQGGTAPNVIPSSARANIGLPPDQVDAFRRRLDELQQRLVTTEDPGLKLQLEAAPETRKPLSAAASAKLVQLLADTPSGVITASPRDPAQPFVSNNLGIVKQLDDGNLELTLMSRSPASAELEKLETRYRALATANGAAIEAGKVVPGWSPNYQSPLLARFLAKYQETTGKEGKVLEIHAGLECGALQTKYPGMDLISVGPDMSGVHSPAEKVSAASTERVYKLLRDVIQDLQK